MEPDDLLDLAAAVVEQARLDEQIEVACSYARTTSILGYRGALESLTTAESYGLGIRVLVNGREGFASAGTLERPVVEAMLAEARDNAQFAEADEFAGLAEPDGVEAVPVDLWSDDLFAMSSDEKVAIALEVEDRVMKADSRSTGVRNASYGDSAVAFALASSAGIRASTRATGASVSVSALAPDGTQTRYGYGYDRARSPRDLVLDRAVDRAVVHTVDLIGSTKPKSATVDLVLDQHLASTIIGLISGTLSGARVIKGRSPYADRLGETVASPLLTIVDDPTNPESMGADSHDGEGLSCRPNRLIAAGVLEQFFHDSYTGRRSGHGSTASAVRGARSLPGPGLHALAVEPGSGSLDEFVADTELGLYVFSLDGLHSGVNPVSGDFSVGVTGRMIRNGRLAEPVSECTVASTLQRMLLDVDRVGADLVHLPSGVSVPSMTIRGVALSGS